mmetsp:Transcript_15645/g.28031  ORF Transcript_15645/g.28031 Transcript_15645/m.28031 type:complete len:240 (-) Transcript_15645:725-1444(-)
MFSANTPPANTLPAGPSIRAFMRCTSALSGKRWIPSPEWSHSSLFPLATEVSSFMMRLTEPPLEVAFALAPPLALLVSTPTREVSVPRSTTLVAFGVCPVATLDAARAFVSPAIVADSNISSSSLSGRASNAGLTSPPRRLRNDTTDSASISSKPSDKEAMWNTDPPVHLAILRKLSSGLSPIMIASTTAPIRFAARSASRGGAPVLFWPSVSASTRRSVSGLVACTGSSMRHAPMIAE